MCFVAISNNTFKFRNKLKKAGKKAKVYKVVLRENRASPTISQPDWRIHYKPFGCKIYAEGPLRSAISPKSVTAIIMVGGIYAYTSRKVALTELRRYDDGHIIITLKVRHKDLLGVDAENEVCCFKKVRVGKKVKICAS